MTNLANTFLLVYAGLFPIVNPVGSAPIFLPLTCSLPEPQRRALPRRVAVNGFLLLLGSLFVGSHLREFFGITLPYCASPAGWRYRPSPGGYWAMGLRRRAIPAMSTRTRLSMRSTR